MKPWQNADILKEAYDRLQSSIEVGEELGTNSTTVRNWMNRFGLKLNLKKGAHFSERKNAGKPWANKETLEAAYRIAGSKALAKKWGCSAAVILVWVRRLGIARRKKTGEGVSYPEAYAAIKVRTNKSFSTKRVRPPGKRLLEMLEGLGRGGKCERCGYKEHPEILQVHHKDEDKFHNDPENLEIDCPNCHALQHRRNKWAYAK